MTPMAAQRCYDRKMPVYMANPKCHIHSLLVGQITEINWGISNGGNPYPINIEVKVVWRRQDNHNHIALVGHYKLSEITTARGKISRGLAIGRSPRRMRI